MQPAGSPGDHTARILGAAPEIRALRAQIERLASFDAPNSPRVPTLLLQGETGSGKGLVARVVHDAGPRRDGPFVAVNCAAIPESLLEAELFGFEAGSFTDAKRHKPGLFEAADGGTLFLDEIDAMLLVLQGKLLDALERKRVRRLGALSERPVDVKVIAATKANLAERSAQGLFRADLHHRLAVMVLDIPPLRHRKNDPVLLAQHFLAEAARAHQLPVKRLSPEAVSWLSSHPWPGNVRELHHLIERVTLLESDDLVDAALLERLAVSQPVAGPPAAPPALGATGEEPAQIRQALVRTGGNVKRAAELLGLTRNALRYRMRKHRIGRPTLAELRTAPANDRMLATQAAPTPRTNDAWPPEARPAQALLVGREAELERLDGWLERAGAGHRQLVFLTGEAGIGKTALLDAFLERAGRRSDVLNGRGQCVDHFGAGEPYMPVLEVLGRLCRQPAGERVLNQLWRHSPTWLAELPGLLDEAERGLLLQRLRGAATKARMLRELADALEAITRAVTVVLALEDLQWSDASTLDLLSVVARRPERARLLVIGTFRRSDALVLQTGLDALQGDLQLRGHGQVLALGPLSLPAVRSYVDRRFAGAAGSARLAESIHRRSGGRPLFMVNLADDLVRRGVVEKAAAGWVVSGTLDDNAGVPLGLVQFIEQRLSRLASDEGGVLEVASVAGDAFDVAAVAAALEADLEEVEATCHALARDRQLLTAAAPEEWPDGTVTARYRFAHALYREVLYGRIAPSRRARLHRQIGLRLEAAWQDAAGEIAAELAVHFGRGADSARALTYSEQAGHNALRRNALEEAIGHYQHALELLGRQPQNASRDARELGLQSALAAPVTMARGYAAPETDRVYARIRRLLGELSPQPAFGPAIVGLARFHLVRAEFELHTELGQRVEAMAQRLGDRDVRLAAAVIRGSGSLFQGECETASQRLEEALSLYSPERHRGLFGDDPGVVCLSFGALASWARGFPDRAVEWAQRAVDLADELDYPPGRYFALVWSGVVRHRRRERAAARASLLEAAELARQYGLGLFEGEGAVFLAWADADPSDVRPQAEAIERALDLIEVSGQRLGVPEYLTVLAEVYALGGLVEPALDALERARRMDQPSDYEPETFRLEGELVSRRAPSGATADDAEARFRHALGLSRRRGARAYELRAATSLARFLSLRDGRVEACQLLAPIVAWFGEDVETPDLSEARRLLDALA